MAQEGRRDRHGKHHDRGVLGAVITQQGRDCESQHGFTEEMLKHDLEERVGIHQEEGKGTPHRRNSVY